MTQLRYTIQQHPINMKAPVKLSHVNLYHCDSVTSNIFPGNPYSKIVYVKKGSGHLYFNNQYLTIHENDLIVMNPDKHKFSVELNQEPIDLVILGIENLHFYSENSPSAFSFIKANFTRTSYRFLVEMIIDEVQSHLDSYEMACNHYLNLLLLEIHRESDINFNSFTKEKGSKDCEFVKNYLDDHFAENITLDILSRESRMNKYYLVHSFTKNFGCSPINYLNEKRIEESKNLLEGTNYSIADIASMIGFSSQSYFSQAFKKNTFMTPNEYRRSTKQI